ncbi:unnamed protein product, partial [Ectocarpus sp. 4 AP-2014]
DGRGGVKATELFSYRQAFLVVYSDTRVLRSNVPHCETNTTVGDGYAWSNTVPCVSKLPDLNISTPITLLATESGPQSLGSRALDLKCRWALVERRFSASSLLRYRHHV